jgi:hypothetical protein
MFDYRYNDTDSIMTELDEFYPYVEMTQVAMNVDRFKGSFDGGELPSIHGISRPKLTRQNGQRHPQAGERPI